MREIAQRAGVSSATVSRVINGSSLVRDETASRIRTILEEVNFIPNPHATTLAYGRSKTFGLIVPDICNPFYGEFVGEFEDLLVELDYEVLLTSVQSSDKLIKSIRRMLMRQVDGAVLMASEFETEAVEPLLRRRIPLVTVDRRSQREGCSDVAIDFETGFAEAVLHLKALGHRRIGYIGGNKGLQTSTVRANAFAGAMQGAGLVYRPELTQCGNYRVAGGEEAVMSLMQAHNPPTAVLTANDLTAFGAIRGLHRLGKSVPDDLSVVGVDDVLLSEVVQPPLTTVRIPRKRMAKTCIEALEHTKKDVEAVGKAYTVPTGLVVRESTSPPSGKRKGKTGTR